MNEDVSPITNGDFPASHVILFRGVDLKKIYAYDNQTHSVTLAGFWSIPFWIIILK